MHFNQQWLNPGIGLTPALTLVGRKELFIPHKLYSSQVFVLPCESRISWYIVDAYFGLVWKN